MFRLFSKLFSRKKSEESVEVVPNEASAGITAEAPTKVSFRELLARMVAKVRFWFYLVLCLSLLTALGVYSYSYIAKVTKASIESAQTVMVNVVTDEVFIGTLHKDPENVREEPTKSPTDEDPKANSTPTDNAEPATLEAEPTNAEKFRAKPLCAESAKKAKVALIITGLGLSKNQTLEVLRAGHNLTLGFSPYASGLAEWVNQAVDKGYEVMLQLPMQPSDYQINDPGLYAMLQNLSTRENLDRLNNLISRSNKIIGFCSPPNEVFSSSKDDIQHSPSGMKANHDAR